jgi:hypothetical protein
MIFSSEDYWSLRETSQKFRVLDDTDLDFAEEFHLTGRALLSFLRIFIAIYLLVCFSKELFAFKNGRKLDFVVALHSRSR